MYWSSLVASSYRPLKSFLRTLYCRMLVNARLDWEVGFGRNFWQLRPDAWMYCCWCSLHNNGRSAITIPSFATLNKYTKYQQPNNRQANSADQERSSNEPTTQPPRRPQPQTLHVVDSVAPVATPTTHPNSRQLRTQIHLLTRIHSNYVSEPEFTPIYSVNQPRNRPLNISLLNQLNKNRIDTRPRFRYGQKIGMRKGKSFKWFLQNLPTFFRNPLTTRLCGFSCEPRNEVPWKGSDTRGVLGECVNVMSRHGSPKHFLLPTNYICASA
jgi:hypothetical protein